MNRHRPDPTILERLQAAGLRADIVAEFRDRHRRRKPCECRLCRAARAEGETAPASERDR